MSRIGGGGNYGDAVKPGVFGAPPELPKTEQERRIKERDAMAKRAEARARRKAAEELAKSQVVASAAALTDQRRHSDMPFAASSRAQDTGGTGARSAPVPSRMGRTAAADHGMSRRTSAALLTSPPAPNLDHESERRVSSAAVAGTGSLLVTPKLIKRVSARHVGRRVTPDHHHDRISYFKHAAAYLFPQVKVKINTLQDDSENLTHLFAAFPLGISEDEESGIGAHQARGGDIFEVVYRDEFVEGGDVSGESEKKYFVRFYDDFLTKGGADKQRLIKKRLLGRLEKSIPGLKFSDEPTDLSGEVLEYEVNLGDNDVAHRLAAFNHCRGDVLFVYEFLRSMVLEVASQIINDKSGEDYRDVVAVVANEDGDLQIKIDREKTYKTPLKELLHNVFDQKFINNLNAKLHDGKDVVELFSEANSHSFVDFLRKNRLTRANTSLMDPERLYLSLAKVGDSNADMFALCPKEFIDGGRKKENEVYRLVEKTITMGLGAHKVPAYSPSLFDIKQDLANKKVFSGADILFWQELIEREWNDSQDLEELDRFYAEGDITLDGIKEIARNHGVNLLKKDGGSDFEEEEVETLEEVLKAAKDQNVVLIGSTRGIEGKKLSFVPISEPNDPKQKYAVLAGNEKNAARFRNRIYRSAGDYSGEYLKRLDIERKRWLMRRLGKGVSTAAKVAQVDEGQRSAPRLSGPGFRASRGAGVPPFGGLDSIVEESGGGEKTSRGGRRLPPDPAAAQIARQKRELERLAQEEEKWKREAALLKAKVEEGSFEVESLRGAVVAAEAARKAAEEEAEAQREAEAAQKAAEERAKEIERAAAEGGEANAALRADLEKQRAAAALDRDAAAREKEAAAREREAAERAKREAEAARKAAEEEAEAQRAAAVREREAAERAKREAEAARKAADERVREIERAAAEGGDANAALRADLEKQRAAAALDRDAAAREREAAERAKREAEAARKAADEEAEAQRAAAAREREAAERAKREAEAVRKAAEERAREIERAAAEEAEAQRARIAAEAEAQRAAAAREREAAAREKAAAEQAKRDAEAVRKAAEERAREIERAAAEEAEAQRARIAAEAEAQRAAAAREREAAAREKAAAEQAKRDAEAARKAAEERAREIERAAAEGGDANAVLRAQLEKQRADLEADKAALDAAVASLTVDEAARREALAKEKGAFAARLDDVERGFVIRDEELTNWKDALARREAEIADQARELQARGTALRAAESSRAALDKEDHARLRAEDEERQRQRDDLARQVANLKAREAALVEREAGIGGAVALAVGDSERVPFAEGEKAVTIETLRKIIERDARHGRKDYDRGLSRTEIVKAQIEIEIGDIDETEEYFKTQFAIPKDEKYQKYRVNENVDLTRKPIIDDTSFKEDYELLGKFYRFREDSEVQGWQLQSQFAGIDFRNIKFGVNSFHLTGFNNCVFRNVDFSEVDPKSFDTVDFANCEFTNDCKFPIGSTRDDIKGLEMEVVDGGVDGRSYIKVNTDRDAEAAYEMAPAVNWKKKHGESWNSVSTGSALDRLGFGPKGRGVAVSSTAENPELSGRLDAARDRGEYTGFSQE